MVVFKFILPPNHSKYNTNDLVQFRRLYDYKERNSNFRQKTSSLGYMRKVVSIFVELENKNLTVRGLKRYLDDSILL